MLQTNDLLAPLPRGDTLMAHTSYRVMALLADPDPSRPLNIAKELGNIQTALEQSRHEFKFIIHPTRSNLEQAIIGGYDILHISSHGHEDGIFLHGPRDEDIEFMSLDALAKLASGKVQCIILNACWSSAIGTRRAMKVPYTIAMNETIADPAAIDYSLAFYRALAVGHEIPDCHDHACLCTSTRHTDFSPVLLRDRSCALGIRSFVPDAEHLPEITEALLTLDSSFRGRLPAPPHTWASITSEVSRFCNDPHLRRRFGEERFTLLLHCHLSIALLAGYYFGYDAPVTPLQGRHVQTPWQRPDEPPLALDLPPTITEHGAREMQAFSLSISHDIRDHAIAYIESIAPNGYSLHDIALPLPTRRSVQSAAHAEAITESVARQMRRFRAKHPTDRIHLFMACPVSLAFTMGQRMNMLGSLQLYEFAPMGPVHYTPSISLPPSQV